MAGNSNLHAAAKAKNDEFYTRLADIENELSHYRDQFRGKVVLCNCDDPFESNFFKYFVLNFNHLGLKKLIATSYAGSPIANKQLSVMNILGDDEQGNSYGIAYKAVVTTVHDANDDGQVDMSDIHRLFELGENQLSRLKSGGDFRSRECIALLDEADIVVTNPPFSLFREYVATLMAHKKKFLIWGNINAITYKEIFPLLKDNEMWLGTIANKTCIFQIPSYYTKWDQKITDKINDGNHYGQVPSIAVYTNLDLKQRHEDMILYRRYTPEEYPHYDNYDAINVNKVTDIPCDYDGVMGVPITFLGSYNPEQFEIIRFRKGNDNKDLRISETGKQPYFRILIRNRHPEAPHEK